MRIAATLLACLGAGALTSALADPPADAPPGKPAATAAPAAPAPAAPAPAAASQAATSDRTVTIQAELDKDTQHFLAEGYKPEMHNGEQIYCKREAALGSRLTAVKNCGTIEQLKVNERRTQAGVSDAQRQQTGTSYH
jgi:hypothetical protein